MPSVPQEIDQAAQQLVDNVAIVEEFANGDPLSEIPVRAGVLRPLAYWQDRIRTFSESALVDAEAIAKARAEAEQSLEAFDSLYLGPLDADPGTKNDGQPLEGGELYFNVPTREMRVYNAETGWGGLASRVYEVVVDPTWAPQEVGVQITQLLGALGDKILRDGGDSSISPSILIRSSDYYSPIHIGSRVQIEEPINNCRVLVLSPLVVTDGGSFRIRGREDEYFRGFDGVTEGVDSIPLMRDDAYPDAVTGNLRLPLEYKDGDPSQAGRANSFKVGDLVVMRGILDPLLGSSLIKFFGLVAEVDQASNEIMLDRPAPPLSDQDDVDRINAISSLNVAIGDPMPFNSTYYEPDGVTELVNPYSGGVMQTRTQNVRASIATENTVSGAQFVPVADASLFDKGDMVLVMDDRSEDDILAPNSTGFTYPMNRVTATVIDVDTVNNRVYLERPLFMELDTAFFARVIRVRPIKNVSLEIGTARYGAEQLIDYRNFYLAQLDFAMNCSAKVGEVNGYDRRRAAAMRISSSLSCRVYDSKIIGATDQSTGGMGYGVMIYYSSGCSVYGCYISGQRHAILVQHASYNRIYDNYCSDDYISAIDLHGTGCFGNLIFCNQVSAIIRNENGPADKRSGIKVGNQSHVVADKFTLIIGNMVWGYRDTDDDGAGIDIVPAATGVVVQGNFIWDCYYGINLGSNSSNRVKWPLKASRIILQANTIFNAVVPIDFRWSTPAETTFSATDLILKDNTFVECDNPARVDGIPWVYAKNNTHMSATGEFSDNYVDITNAEVVAAPSAGTLLDTTTWETVLEALNGEAVARGNLRVPDGSSLIIGSEDDLVLTHDGVNNIIRHSGKGDLILDGADDPITFTSSNNGVIRLRSVDSGAFIEFVDPDTTMIPSVGVDGDELIFDVGGARVGRFRADRRFVFGQSNTDSPNSSTTAENAAIRETGQVRVGVKGDYALSINRHTSNGRLFELRQEGAVVGTFETDSAHRLTFSPAPGGGVRFDPSLAAAGSESQTLDHYERGRQVVTATPGTSGAVTLGANELYVTRTGRAVSLSGQVVVSEVAAPVGDYLDIGALAIPAGTLAKNPTAAGGSALLFDGVAYRTVPYLLDGGSNVIRVFLDASTLAAGSSLTFSIVYHA